MSKGILYGISTGPGDPELLTLKAVRLLNSVPVIAAPRTRGENCMALDIIRGVVPTGDKEIIYLDFAMKRDPEILKASHQAVADSIIPFLEAGKDVAMLNIGDASLFGTYGYIRTLIHDAGYETRTVPGVTSFSAVAAVLDRDLTTMNEPLMIVPGGSEDLAEILRQPGTKVLMKSASSFPAVRKALEDAGLSKVSGMVSDCGLPTEKVFPDLSEAPENSGYFTTILVGSKPE